MDFDLTSERLRIALHAAVPLHVFELRSCPFDEIQERAHRASQIVAEKGDIVMFRSKKKGESAAAFNALAEGIACLSFAPGGVVFLGDRYQTIDGNPQITVAADRNMQAAPAAPAAPAAEAKPTKAKDDKIIDPPETSSNAKFIQQRLPFDE